MKLNVFALHYHTDLHRVTLTSFLIESHILERIHNLQECSQGSCRMSPKEGYENGAMRYFIDVGSVAKGVRLLPQNSVLNKPFHYAIR